MSAGGGVPAEGAEAPGDGGLDGDALPTDTAWAPLYPLPSTRTSVLPSEESGCRVAPGTAAASVRAESALLGPNQEIVALFFVIRANVGHFFCRANEANHIGGVGAA